MSIKKQNFLMVWGFTYISVLGLLLVLYFWPGNVYVYPPDTKAPWSEDTNHAAPTPLGRIREKVEHSYRDSGVQTILLRAGDFIDTEPTGGWFDRVLMSRFDRGQIL